MALGEVFHDAHVLLAITSHGDAHIPNTGFGESAFAGFAKLSHGDLIAVEGDAAARGSVDNDPTLRLTCDFEAIGAGGLHPWW